jgi:hypothetical protein
LLEILTGCCGTRYPEKADVREETLEGPGMQQWHMGKRPKTEDMRQKSNKGTWQKKNGSCVLRSIEHQMGSTGKLSDRSS